MAAPVRRRRRPSRSDYQALAEFRYQIRRFLAFSARHARATRLEPQQHQALLALKGLPRARRPTVGHLAERLQLRHHSAVELVDRLTRRGLVSRRRSRGDRREVLLHVTARGEAVLRELSRHHLVELRSVAPALGAALGRILARTKGASEAKA